LKAQIEIKKAQIEKEKSDKWALAIMFVDACFGIAANFRGKINESVLFCFIVDIVVV
jgi:hypothetical protein